MRVLRFLSNVTTILTLTMVVLLTACSGGGGDGDGGAAPTDGGGGTTPPAPDTTLDQEFDPSANLTVNLPIGTDDYAQTFTVGRTGVLGSVELLLSNPGGATGTLRVDVRGTTGGAPNENDAAALASSDFEVAAFSSLPGFVKIDVSGANIPVVSGDVLAIVLRRITGDPFVGVVHGTSVEPYERGAVFTRAPASTFMIAFDADFGLRTRVVSSP